MTIKTEEPGSPPAWSPGAEWPWIDATGLQEPERPDYQPSPAGDPDWQVLLHEELEEWMTNPASDAALRRRVLHCLRELVVRGRTGKVKAVKGAGKGWLRSPLGGTGGSHYYLWWARHGAIPVDGTGLSKGQILARCVRHHDLTSVDLPAGDPDDWGELELGSLQDTGTDSPFEPIQIQAAVNTDEPVGLLRGLPGSGKTTTLQLAASRATGPKSLYLTYSNGLARRSEEYFAPFGPEGTATDVMTFRELLADLGSVPVETLAAMDPRRGARRLEQALESVHSPLGPWKGRPDELYVELHAHAVGRALPMPFRGLPGCENPVLPKDAYIEARSSEIGFRAATVAADVAHHLLEEGLLGDLFPGPARAHAAITGLDVEPPERMQGVESVFVDEVQDLTMLEAALLVTLVGRITLASNGRLPRVVVAGDEAQTVRPTAFEWEWLNELFTTLLAIPGTWISDIPLSGSLRAPEVIAALITNLQEQYRRLPRAHRPSSVPYDSVNDDTEGRLVYCRIADPADWPLVHDFFAAASDSRLVYPGYRVPDGIAPNNGGDPPSTSDQVKGLDYQLVGVADAGRRELELQELAEKSKTDPLHGLWARGLADQYRVAVSRTTETLVLLDHGDDDLTSTVKELCGDDVVDHLQLVEPSELRSLLDEDLDPVDLVMGALEEAERTIDDDPGRALQRLRNTREDFETALGSSDIDDDIAEQVQTLHGVAATMMYLEAEDLSVSERDRCAAEARSMLGATGHGDLLELVVSAKRSLEHPVSTASITWAGATARELGRDRSRPQQLETQLRNSALRWNTAVRTGSGLPVQDEAVDSLVDAMTALARSLEPSNPELLNGLNDSLADLADHARSGDRGEAALILYRRIVPEPADLVGSALEGLGRWRDAMEHYLEAGMSDEALRSARQIPDFESARSISEDSDPEVADLMRWASTLLELSDPEVLAVGEPLTVAEHEQLLEHLTTALDSALQARPGERPPLIPETAQPSDTGTTTTGTDPDDGGDDETPTSDDSSEPPDAQPAPGRGSTTTETMTISDLGSELGLTVEESLDLCRMLGIPAGGADSKITDLMANRVRKRHERNS